VISTELVSQNDSIERRSECAGPREAVTIVLRFSVRNSGLERVMTEQQVLARKARGFLFALMFGCLIWAGLAAIAVTV
jgi:hypothetical protein